MAYNIDDIRARVDALRDAVRSGSLSEEAAVTSMASLEIVRKNDLEDFHAGDNSHRCPWHTCQATRH